MDGTRNSDQGRSMSWQIEGVDCASCVAKVEKAVTRLPGVSDVTVNLMAERLTLRLEPGQTGPDTLERTVSPVGYAARLLLVAASTGSASHPVEADGAGHGHDENSHAGHDHGEGGHSATFGHSNADHEDPADTTKPWYATGKARLVWLLGGLVLGAYALSLVLPDRLTYLLFLAATLVALVPFGRRAFALARAGSPFSIETLMVTAALGATVIGAAQEAAVALSC